MFLRNYDATKEYMGIYGAKLSGWNKPYIINTDGNIVYFPISVGINNGKSATAMCNAWVNKLFSNLGEGEMCISLGTGDTPVTYNDYKLASAWTSGINLVSINIGTLKYNAATRKWTMDVQYDIKNNSGASVTVKEIGWFTNCTTVGKLMVYREVLAEPVTLADQEYYQYKFTYDTGFTYPNDTEISDGWDTIVSNINGGNASLYNVGDTKGLSFTLNGTTYSIKMRLVGKAHDDLTATGKAATTWMAERCFATHNMESTNTNANGWGGCAMRTWLQGDVLDAIVARNAALAVSVNGIKMVDKIYTKGTSSTTYTSSDSLFLPCWEEIGGSSMQYYVSGQGSAYSWFDNANKRKIPIGVADYFWLRSANTTDSRNFWSVATSGGSASYSASCACGVAPCFCI